MSCRWVRVANEQSGCTAVHPVGGIVTVAKLTDISAISNNQSLKLLN